MNADMFFFSSRRRHTRSLCDWSSDVCSSDLGRLDTELPVGSLGGTLRVELNHIDAAVLPAGFRLGDNDTRILSVARSLANESHDVVLVSKDVPLRVKAAAIGLEAQEYRAE